MFTGIIEKVGQVTQVLRRGPGLRLEIETGFSDLVLGESVAVDGVCLTVVELGVSASFDVSPETLERTSLNGIYAGRKVNLERAMRADGRFSGHIVQGHVDGVGQLEWGTEHADGSRNLRVRVSSSVGRYCVEKGSITVQGVSLTINRIQGDWVEIMIVPHTWSHTSFSALESGTPVNLEADMIAKYVEKLICR